MDSLFISLKFGRCPYFYVCTHAMTMLFTSLPTVSGDSPTDPSLLTDWLASASPATGSRDRRIPAQDDVTTPGNTTPVCESSASDERTPPPTTAATDNPRTGPIPLVTATPANTPIDAASISPSASQADSTEVPIVVMMTPTTRGFRDALTTQGYRQSRSDAMNEVLIL